MQGMSFPQPRLPPPPPPSAPTHHYHHNERSRVHYQVLKIGTILRKKAAKSPGIYKTLVANASVWSCRAARLMSKYRLMCCRHIYLSLSSRSSNLSQVWMGLILLRQRRNWFVKEIYVEKNTAAVLVEGAGGKWGTENERRSPSMERNAIHLSWSLSNSSAYGSHWSDLNKAVVI